MMIIYTDGYPYDIDRLADLEEKIFGRNAYTRDFLLYLLTHSDFFKIARADEEISGYICGEVVFDTGHLISLAVAEEYRGRGIGSSLLNIFLKFLKEKNIDSAYLEVSVENYNAIEFYRKRGFKIVDSLPRYYADGTDAYIMIIDVK